MPRFYFHLQRPDGLMSDDVGMELPSPEVAYLEACKAITDTIVELVADGFNPAHCAFHVADQRGECLWTVPMLERVRTGPSPRSDELRQRLDNASADLRRELEEFRLNRASVQATVDALRRSRLASEALRRQIKAKQGSAPL